MPIYEYKCDGCSAVFEVFQKVSDPPPEQHSCGSTQVHRVLSNTSFVLKGTGWYITDYGRKDKDPPGGKKKKDEGSSDSSSNTSTSASADAKPAAKKNDSGGPNSSAAA